VLAHTPAEIHVRFQTAFNRGDVEALAALYEPQAILVVNGQNVSGRENIKAAFQTILQRPGRMTLDTRSVVESAEGLAVLHGAWIIERPAELVTRGLGTEVVRLQPDGTWLFVIDEPSTPVGEI
jgi:uncharacterized protein (TIGR02246 family)